MGPGLGWVSPASRSKSIERYRLEFTCRRVSLSFAGLVLAPAIRSIGLKVTRLSIAVLEHHEIMAFLLTLSIICVPCGLMSPWPLVTMKLDCDFGCRFTKISVKVRTVNIPSQ